MSEPPGQVRTEIAAKEGGGAASTVISAGREVEQGARSMLLLAEGLFRLDVIPQDDTIQTVLRSLVPAMRAELRAVSVGGATEVLGDIEPPSTGRFGGEVMLIGENGDERPVARVLVGSVCHLDRGVTGFTAQATLGKTGA